MWGRADPRVLSRFALTGTSCTEAARMQLHVSFPFWAFVSTTTTT